MGILFGQVEGNQTLLLTGRLCCHKNHFPIFIHDDDHIFFWSL